jgi:hypothetical protein
MCLPVYPKAPVTTSTGDSDAFSSSTTLAPNFRRQAAADQVSRELVDRGDGLADACWVSKL